MGNEIPVLTRLSRLKGDAKGGGGIASAAGKIDGMFGEKYTVKN